MRWVISIVMLASSLFNVEGMGFFDKKNTTKQTKKRNIIPDKGESTATTPKKKRHLRYKNSTKISESEVKKESTGPKEGGSTRSVQKSKIKKQKKLIKKIKKEATQQKHSALNEMIKDVTPEALSVNPKVKNEKPLSKPAIKPKPVKTKVK